MAEREAELHAAFDDREGGTGVDLPDDGFPTARAVRRNTNPMRTAEIRRRFLDFFALRPRGWLTSAPLLYNWTRRCCSSTPAW